MRPDDLKIGTQLRLGLGMILVFVGALGALAWRQSDLLWLQTSTMYDHPLQVTRAVGALGVDVESMSRHVRDLFLARSEQETALALQNIELEKSAVERQFAVLFDRYLGPRGDINALHEAFARWNAIRDETVRLLRAGKTAEAEERIRPGGVQDAQAQAVGSSLRKISDFATGKGDQLHRTAREERRSLNRRLAAIVVAILLLSLAVFLRLIKAIKGPLQELTAATEQFREGKLEVRSRYFAANEFGALAASFNAMADALHRETQLNDSAARLAGVMLREEEAQGFCRELLKGLLEHTGSQVGAVYFLNETKTAFEHFASIGLGAGGRAAFSATEREGEFGAALASRRIERITDIPPQTRFSFAAVSGDFAPREILTIPVPADHGVSAVISLASVRAYDKASLRLVEEIWNVLTARVNGVLAFRRIRALAERLEAQNRELDAQKRELDAQASELTQQNSELELQKQQLGEASRLKSAFLSKMSHELRTPLNSVIALSGVLGRRLEGRIPAEELDYLEVIERNGRHLLSLINDILDLSRVEAGREEISLSRFSLRALVADVVAMIKPQAREKGVALETLVGRDLPSIASDPEKCRHILQNLVANAVKFTDAGSVAISARREGNELLVAVRDTGIGIAAEQIPHIFEEFRQADDSTSRRFGGTGLGLAIAAKYAELLQGGISVESAPGKGSTFTLRLPLALEAPDGVDGAASGGLEFDSAAESALPPPGQGQCLLLVEDSEPAVVQMTDILAGQGYRVHVARSGGEALAWIEQTLPDAMILDLMMPEIDGFEVLRQIRRAPRTTRLPVLILTAKHVTREELSFLKGNHIHQLIQKGDVGRSELLTAVARMVAPPQEPTVPPRSGSGAPAGPAHPGRPVVLVVEDNPDNRCAARALLSDRYQVIEAEDGQTAIRQTQLHRPDLILMDIAMPVMDGIAALREIRKDEALRHIPVIAVTASAMVGDRETILAHGFDGYLSKPIDAELLKKTLHEALD